MSSCARRRRNHRHCAAAVVEESENIALCAIIDRDHVKARRIPPAVAAFQRPAHLVPIVALGRAHRRNEVHPVDSGPGGRLGAQRVEVEGAVGRMGDDRVRHAALADERRQRAGVDAGHANDSPRFEPAVEPRLRAEIRGTRNVGAHDGADRSRGGRRIDDFDVLVVDADDPDMREGEGDDLGGVGRICQDFLVARHCRVEADLADRGAGRADPEALDHRAVRKNDNARRDARKPPGRRIVRGRREVSSCCA